MTLTSLMSHPLPAESVAVQQRTYVTYTFREGSSTFTLLESRSIISAGGTTGLRTWESSLHLASFLTSKEGASYVNGKRILELGSGTGLVSIVCANLLGIKYVLATDGSQEVVDALQDNLFLNGLQDDSHIDGRILRWGQYLEEDEDGQEKVFDVVLGADIVRRGFLPSPEFY
jgi:protein-lysine N-methyltransferase EEF2KMT